MWACLTREPTPALASIVERVFRCACRSAFTDILQSLIVICAVVFVALLAGNASASHSQPLCVLAEQVTGNADWTRSSLPLKTSMPPGYEPYKDLFLFAMFYMLPNLMFGVSTGATYTYYNDDRVESVTFSNWASPTWQCSPTVYRVIP